ncbi:hypothetical protein NLJ89_g4986 [Agrocybe chaxingu]|uniref:Uncharacterized protein n=1 Tax=Agrocybe chaxingu TaxID=84603 RepID=A0A9W8K334_9AGAR|nr:hypothetical protein NLJ89_g4986 [Agrocybe chaxingu]
MVSSLRRERGLTNASSVGSYGPAQLELMQEALGEEPTTEVRLAQLPMRDPVVKQEPPRSAPGPSGYSKPPLPWTAGNSAMKDEATREQVEDLTQHYQRPGSSAIGIASDLRDRIILQKIQDGDMGAQGFSNYVDQGIRWENGRMFDLMQFMFEQALARDAEARRTQPAHRTAGAPNPGDPGDDNGDDGDDDDPRRGNSGGPPRDPPKPPPPRHESSPPDKKPPHDEEEDDGIDRRKIRWSLPPPSRRRTSLMPATREVQSRYQDEMYRRLINIIHDHCGERKDMGGDKDRPRPPSIDTVPKYKGDERMKTLETWVTDASIYFAIANMSGPDKAFARVYFAELLVEDKAKDFIRHHVFGLNREKVKWTFEEIATALYDRFVLPSVTQDARALFNKVRFDPSTGVQGFYDKICDISETMMDHPDRFTLADRFLRGLPQNWRKELFDQDFTPEINTIEEMVAEAKAIEAAEKTARHYDHGTSFEVYTNHTMSQAHKRIPTSSAKFGLKKMSTHAPRDSRKGTHQKEYVRAACTENPEEENDADAEDGDESDPDEASHENEGEVSAPEDDEFEDQESEVYENP